MHAVVVPRRGLEPGRFRAKERRAFPTKDSVRVSPQPVRAPGERREKLRLRPRVVRRAGVCRRRVRVSLRVRVRGGSVREPRAELRPQAVQSHETEKGTGLHHLLPSRKTSGDDRRRVCLRLGRFVGGPGASRAGVRPRPATHARVDQSCSFTRHVAHHRAGRARGAGASVRGARPAGCARLRAEGRAERRGGAQDGALHRRTHLM
mmetsp:Transcript_1470/g.5945  ORF Transcript_1470/g.5945 Transcript_1470/m.5945 type:complete len:206 (-) Transcript_1470:779-1396(-)